MKSYILKIHGKDEKRANQMHKYAKKLLTQEKIDFILWQTRDQEL